MSKTFRIIEIFDTQMIAFLNIEQRKFLIRRTFFLQYNIEKKLVFTLKMMYIMINICVIICNIFLYGSG